MQDLADKTTDSARASAPQLSAIELRVLGVLMEKQLTTPEQYPLTLNSVVTACNQKSSRDPISHYNQGEVSRALQELDTKHFVRKEYGSRSDKFTQQFMDHLELGRKQQALLCVMMLRGPQTISELNTRTQRMCEFTDKEELESTLDRLCDRGVPYAVRLGQQPGQRGERIGHLFSGAPSVQTPAPDQTPTATPTDNLENAEDLQQQIDSLKSTVSELKQEVAQLKNQLSELSETTS